MSRLPAALMRASSSVPAINLLIVPFLLTACVARLVLWDGSVFMWEFLQDLVKAALPAPKPRSAVKSLVNPASA